MKDDISVAALSARSGEREGTHRKAMGRVRCLGLPTHALAKSDVIVVHPKRERPALTEIAMGLYVHSLNKLPLGLNREYYLYVLDYGWDEPLGTALHENFRRMADLAAKNQAVVIAGTDARAFTHEVLSVHIDDPQFSYQSVNGEPGDELLPALMITTIHPGKFKETNPEYRFSRAEVGQADDKLILLPLRSVCQNATEVMALIERIFRDIAANKPLREFSVAKEIHAGQHGAYSDAFILKPALWGVGVDLKELLKTWKQKRT